MKKRPDIRVEIYRAGSTEVGAKLAAEREVGGIRADLLWLADAPIYYEFRQRGELLSYISPEAKAIPADLKDPKGFFTAGRLINMIIAVNTQVTPLKDAPKSWKDFPDFGKKAAMGNPLYSGSNFVTVAAFVKKDGNWSWFERARAKSVAIVRGNSEAADALAGKEFGIAMTLDYIIAGLVKKGAPLVTIWPTDGAISVPSPLLLSKPAKIRRVAKPSSTTCSRKRGRSFWSSRKLFPCGAMWRRRKDSLPRARSSSCRSPTSGPRKMPPRSARDSRRSCFTKAMLRASCVTTTNFRRLSF